jgi:hypothetical protein
MYISIPTHTCYTPPGKCRLPPDAPLEWGGMKKALQHIEPFLVTPSVYEDVMQVSVVQWIV